MSSTFHLGEDGEQPDTPELLTPDVEHKLEDLGVSIPQEIPVEEIAAATEDRLTLNMSDSVTTGASGKLTYSPADIGVGDANIIGTATGGNPKDALGMKKPNLALVPPSSSLYQAHAMMDGAAKYGPYNWRGNPVLAMVYISAAQRHIAAYLDGENIDPISGVPHIGHALACLGIIADATETGNLKDDRPAFGPAGDMVRRFNDTQSFKR